MPYLSLGFPPAMPSIYAATRAFYALFRARYIAPSLYGFG